MPPDRLFVIWREPRTRRRHVIGHLRRQPDGYAFWYDPDGLREVAGLGFQPLIEFPDPSRAAQGEAYTGRYLFATFAQRIPSPVRSDYAEILGGWGVEHPDDQMEVLAKSGGVQATSALELAEYRDPEGGLTEPLELRVTALEHFDARTSGELEVDARIELQRDPENDVDPHATFVLTADGRRIGYVPRQYSRLVARLIEDGGRVDARFVRYVSSYPDRRTPVVRVQRS